MINFAMRQLNEKDFSRIYNFILEKASKHIRYIKTDEEKTYLYNNFWQDTSEIYVWINQTTMEIDTITLHGSIYDWIFNTLEIKKIDEDGTRTYVRLVKSQCDEMQEDYTPGYARALLFKMMQKYYTVEEMHSILSEIKCPNRTKQLHHIETEQNKILRFDNCVYLDLNKAHSYMMSIIFPKAKELFIELAKKAKKEKKYKNLVNYTVGMLNHQSNNKWYYPEVYNYIVTTISQIMIDKLDDILGENSTIVYLNTDGMVIQNPRYMPESSLELGDFKIETDETVFYTYKGENYIILQYGDTLKGNLPLSMKEHIDLRINKTIKVKKTLDKTTNTFIYEVDNDEDRI